MRVGWLADNPPYRGGAEMNADAFKDAAPPGVDIVDCPPDNVVSDCDMYVVHNCTSYSRWIIPRLKGKPVYKMCHDIWRDGDVMLRGWLTRNARMIFVSPTMGNWINWRMGYNENTDIPAYIPSPIDISKFTSDNTDRNGKAIWVGRLHENKGVTNAIQWANANDVTLDIYGYGDESLAGEHYRGEITNDALPALLSNYSKFVFLPDAPDSCPRTTLEAYAAGCELVINGYVGSKYWLTKEPDALTSATSDFWRVING